MSKSVARFALPVAAASMAALLLAGCSASVSATEEAVDDNQPVAQDDISLLLAALDDEYRAEAIYEAVLEKFGEDTRPFSNIIRAEQKHSDAAKAQLDRLGAQYPDANTYSGTITAPDTLLAACQTGITAEEENIALYDRLLPHVQDEQVKMVLERLRWASQERHLPAFHRCVDRGGTMGGGMGGGPGGGMGGGMGPGHGGGMGGGPGHGAGSGD